MIRPGDLLSLSQSLLCDNEAKNRTAISRAYYSCFHAIKELSINNISYIEPGRDEKKSPHWHLCKYLIDQDNLDIKSIGSQLRNLHKKRKHADYDIGETISRNNSTLAVAMASALIEQSNIAIKKPAKEKLGPNS